MPHRWWSGSRRQCHPSLFVPLQFQCQPPCQPDDKKPDSRRDKERRPAGYGGCGRKPDAVRSQCLPEELFEQKVESLSPRSTNVSGDRSAFGV